MLPFILGAAGLGLGLAGMFKQSHDNRVAQAEQNAANERANAENMAMQREFAQNGIRWRVEDARAAGIHLLYALGAQGAQASPISVGASSYPDQTGSIMSSLGQDISRAAQATRTAEERAFAQLQLQRGHLENELLRTQIHQLQGDQVGPPMPGTTGLVTPQANKPVVQDPGAPGREAGSINDYAYARRGNRWFVVPAKDAKERMEDNMLQESLWAWRNQALPFFATEKPDPIWGRTFKAPEPPSEPLPKGYKWKWDGVAYEQVRK